MLLSTRKIDHLYKFLIPACKLNIEKHKKKKIKIEFFKINNSIDFNYLIFFFLTFLILKCSKKINATSLMKE